MLTLIVGMSEKLERLYLLEGSWIIDDNAV